MSIAFSNSDFFAELRTFINIELRIDNARPENLLGLAGTWVKNYRKQIEEEGPKASGPRIGEADYKETMGEWVEALDSIAVIRTAAQTRIGLDRALVINQNEMLQDQLTMHMRDKARRAEEAEAAFALTLQAHED